MSDQKPNTFFIDDREIDIREGETIFRAARRLDIKLPHLCYTPKPGYRPDGNCRVCMVEIEGERVLAASCIRTPAPGMKVKTQTDRAKTARKMVAELLLTDQPAMEVSVRWDEGHAFLLREMKVVRKTAAGQSAVSHITQRIGWDPLSRQLRSWSFSSDGGHARASMVPRACCAATCPRPSHTRG